MLLKAGASPNAQTSEKEPILCLSIEKKLYDITSLLLNSGVDLNATDLKKQTALHYAASRGFRRTRMLLAAGANANAKDERGWIPIFHSIAKGKWKTVDLLLSDSDLMSMGNYGETALHVALKNCQFPRPEDALEKLIENGAPVDNFSGYAPAVSCACLYADLDAVKTLVKAGCDVHQEGIHGMIMNEVAEIRWPDPSTPNIKDTMTAMAEVLIEAGADVDAGNKPQTPLMDTVIALNYSMARLFLQANCDTVLLDEYDCTLFSRDELYGDFLRESKGNTDCATYVMVDACCAEDDQEIQKLYFECFKENKELVDDLGVQLEHPPISLYRLCRVAVGASLPTGRAFHKAEEQLPLPQHVKDFVAFRNN